MTLKRSLKVIENGTIRKLGYGFLFDFHSNYGRILHRLRDTAIYWSKIVIFFITPVFDAPARGVRVTASEYCETVWCAEN